MSTRHRFLYAIPALLAAGLTTGATIPTGAAAEQFTLKVVNVDTVEQRIFSLGHLVGDSPKTPKKLVVLSFFATYCEPYKRELPLLQALYTRYADQGLGVLVVSIDKDKDVPGGAAAAVDALAKEHGLSFPVLHDRFNIVAKRYGVEKLPCLYLIDGAGQVALTNVGYTDDFSETLTKEVQTRLGVPVEPIAHGSTAVGPKVKKKHP
ncbi:MAG: TlpA disulfide reductase family protein [Pseudomonadota bacterium]